MGMGGSERRGGIRRVERGKIKDEDERTKRKKRKKKRHKEEG